MSADGLREKVSPHNPWWTTGGTPSELEDLRRSDYKHHFDLLVESRKRLLVLSGRKGIGKTNTVHRLINDLHEQDDIDSRDILYFPLDDPSYQLEDTGRVITDIVEWYRKHILQDRDREHFVFLDDVHSVGEQNWRKQVSEVLEAEDVHVIVTTVHGRLEDVETELGYEVPPPHMLPRKFFDYVSEDFSDREKAKHEAHEARHSILESLSEGEPEVLGDSFERMNSLTEDIDVAGRLQEYESGDKEPEVPSNKNISDQLELTIYKEIPRVRGFRDVAGAHSLCKHIAETPPEQVSYRDLESELGIESRQLKRYVEALNDFYLVNPVYPYNYDVRRNFRLYLQNPNYAYTFSSAEERVYNRKVRETVVLDHLKRLSFFFHSRESQYTVTSGGKTGKGADAYNFKQDMDFVFNYYPDFAIQNEEMPDLPTHEVSLPTGTGGERIQAASVPIIVDRPRGNGVERMEKTLEKVNDHSSEVRFETGIVLSEGDDVSVYDRAVEIPRHLFALVC